MNNNQDFNNNNPTNPSSIPVIPPQQQPVENNPLASMTAPVTNVIPQNNNTPNPQQEIMNQTNNEPVILGVEDNQSYSELMNIAPAEETRENQFINTGYNETAITDLNIEGTYNNNNVNPHADQAPSYVNDEQVRENMNPTQKNTVSISKELKTVFLIVAVMIVFIIIMPFLFELVSNIRFN